MRGNVRIAAALTLAALLPRIAWACSVCMGDPNSGQVQGMNMSILSLMGVTGRVLAGVGLFAAMLWRRSIALEGETDAPRSASSQPEDPIIG